MGLVGCTENLPMQRNCYNVVSRQSQTASGLRLADLIDQIDFVCLNKIQTQVLNSKVFLKS